MAHTSLRQPHHHPQQAEKAQEDSEITVGGEEGNVAADGEAEDGNGEAGGETEEAKRGRGEGEGEASQSPAALESGETDTSAFSEAIILVGGEAGGPSQGQSQMEASS
mmetsp:Transcript_92866/g.265140  ORF Transcript_92866/g.265140 Transcript_92866/m.265140 type:complete len:108 (-) Transcript_92866:420-743(-)